MSAIPHAERPAQNKNAKVGMFAYMSVCEKKVREEESYAVERGCRPACHATERPHEMVSHQPHCRPRQLLRSTVKVLLPAVRWQARKARQAWWVAGAGGVRGYVNKEGRNEWLVGVR